MSFSTISSFIIGGLLLLSILALNNRVMNESGDTTYNYMSKKNIDNISQVMTFDMQNLGYGVADSAITEATEYSITFKTDINNDGKTDIVRWDYDTSIADQATNNPNDHPLYRIVNGLQTTLHACITSFKFSYILSNGTETYNPTQLDQIKNIRIQIIAESPEKYNGYYEKSTWQKLFTPANLQF